MGRLISLPQTAGGIGCGQSKPAVDAHASGRTSGPKTAGRLTVAVGVRGVLALLFGFLALLWPGITAPRLALVFGAYALLNGVVLIGTLADETVQESLRWGHLLAGFASLLVGLMALLWPHITGLTLALLAGTWAVVVGLVETAAATTGLLEAPLAGRRRRVRAAVGLLAVVGIASMDAGLMTLMRPDAGAVPLATVLGTYALIAGSVLLAAAWQLRDVISWSR
ncbi:MAG: HdeD family acid-resistance protein [Mycobacteriaceae bacterium]